MEKGGQIIRIGNSCKVKIHNFAKQHRYVYFNQSLKKCQLAKQFYAYPKQKDEYKKIA